MCECYFKATLCRTMIRISIITNSCTHSSIFIKNTLNVHVKLLVIIETGHIDARFKHEV